jgi:hypothetical protein
MTYTETAPPTTVRPAPPHRALLMALAITAPLGALAMGIGDLIAPYSPADYATTVLAKVAADPTAVDILGWLFLVAVICLLPGVLVAGLAALRGAPRLATVALLIAIPGWSAAFAFPDTDGLAAVLASSGIPQADAVELYASVGEFSRPSQGFAVLLFVVGHIVGTVLLGVALWRSRAVPRFAAAALAISQPLHFVAFVILMNNTVDAVAAFLTALGFGAAGIAYLRQSTSSSA